MRMTYSGVWFGLNLATYIHKPWPHPHARSTILVIGMSHLQKKITKVHTEDITDPACLQKMRHCNIIGVVIGLHSKQYITVAHLDGKKIFSPGRISLLVAALSCIFNLVSHESCMVLKKSIHVCTKAAYLKFHSNPIHSTDPPCFLLLMCNFCQFLSSHCRDIATYSHVAK